MKTGNYNSRNSFPPGNSYFNSVWRFAAAFFLFFFLFSGLSFASTLTVGRGKQYSRIQAAVDDASCGDTIDIYDDIYDETVTVSIACTVGNELVIQAAIGQSSVIMDGGGANKRAFLFTSSVDSVILKGITIRNYPYAGGANAGGIIGLMGTSTDGIYNVILNGLHIYGDGGDGLCDKCGTSGDETANYYMLDLEFTHNTVIKNSTFIGKSNAYGAGSNIILHLWKSDNVLVQNNIFNGGLYYLTYIFQANDSIFEKNQFISSNYTHRHFQNRLRNSERATVRYNYFDCSATSSDDYSCLNLWDDTKRTEAHKIYNNLFVGGGEIGGSGAPLRFTGHMLNIEIMNNMIMPMGTAEACIGFAYANSGSSANFDIHNNLCQWPTFIVSGGQSSVYSYTEYDNLKNVTDVLVEGLNGKPSPYYRPSNASAPQVDTGSPVPGYKGTDFDSRTIVKNPDIGAFEYISNEQLIADLPPNPPLLISID